MIFYDFVGGLDSPSSSIRLMASLYRCTTAFGHPAGLHASATVSDPALGIVAIIGAKQPILPYVKRMLCFLLLNMLTSEIIAFFSKMICPDSCIHHLIPEQEAQLPQRNSASAAHMEGAKPSSPLPLPRLPPLDTFCIRSNPKPAINVRQACRP